MSVTAPWWAVPAFTLVSTLAGFTVTAVWNRTTERARRRADRAARLEPDNIALYRAYVHACCRMLDAGVWPVSRAEAPPPTAPLVDEVRRIGVDIAFSAPAEVTAAVRASTAALISLAATVDTIRNGTPRPPGGELTGPPAERYATVRRGLADAVDEFIRTARRDVGVTAPYASAIDRP